MYRLRLRSCKLTGVFVISPLPSFLLESLQTAGPLRSTEITPLRRYCWPLRHPLAFHRFPGVSGYTASCSADFSTGRGGLLQLLNRSLSPCCPYHPARVSCRLGQPAPCHAAFAPNERARPPDLCFVSRPPLGLLSLRPGDSLTILIKMALSVGFIRFVSSVDATQAKGLLTFAPVGLPPTEHALLLLDTLVRQNSVRL